MPRPSAASNSTIALASPPEAAPTITASAVAMKSALPSPQPRRKPAIAPMLDAAPASALNSTTSTSPASSVRRGPMREDDPAADQHRHAGHREVGGEQQRDLARRRLQVVGERGEDRVDEADAHEGDDAREGHGPHGSWLLQQMGAMFVVHAVADSRI